MRRPPKKTGGGDKARFKKPRAPIPLAVRALDARRRPGRPLAAVDPTTTTGNGTTCLSLGCYLNVGKEIQEHSGEGGGGNGKAILVALVCSPRGTERFFSGQCLLISLSIVCFFFNNPDNGVVGVVMEGERLAPISFFYNYNCLLLLEAHKFVISLMAEFGVVIGAVSAHFQSK